MVKNGEAAEVLSHVDSNPDNAAHMVYDLHKRHGDEVIKAIEMAVEHHPQPFAHRTLPPTCLLSIATNTNALSTGSAAAPQLTASMQDEMPTHQCEVSREKLSIVCGIKSLPLGPTMEFELAEALFKRKGRWIQTHDLIEIVWEGRTVTENTVARHISSLRRRLREAGIMGITITGENHHYKLEANC
jgi:DNA-binding response OmpR family regulator